MLVRFLSFVATVFGTAKYKAILLSSFALIVSLTGIMAVVATQSDGGHPRDDASAVVHSQATLGFQNGTSQVTRQSEAAANNRSDQQSSTNQRQDDTSAKSSKSPATTPTANDDKQDSGTTAVTISTSAKSPMTISQGATSEAISFTSSDGSTLTWSVESSDNADLQVALAANSKTSASSVAFQVTASSTAPAGTYQVTVTAKDTNRNILITKSLDITVQ